MPFFLASLLSRLIPLAVFLLPQAGYTQSYSAFEIDLRPAGIHHMQTSELEAALQDPVNDVLAGQFGRGKGKGKGFGKGGMPGKGALPGKGSRR